MQVKCAYSGLTFHCQHFPASVSSRELVHPVFYLKPAKLISLTTLWAEGKLEPTDSYLLFLALLDSSSLVEFRTPVTMTANTNQIVALNMEHLVSLVTKFLHIPETSRTKILPYFSISTGSNDLSNISSWLGAWESALEDFTSGYRGLAADKKQRAHEGLLERVIKDSSKQPRHYSQLLANWAELAGRFPTGMTLLAGNQKVPLNLYWKSLIVKCCLDDSIFTVSQKDLEELLEHCEQEIPHGSIYAHSLMTVLRNAKQAQDDFFSGGITTYKVLSATSPEEQAVQQDVEARNIARIISSAPATEPARHEYPTFAAFLKAKVAWNMKQEAQSGQHDQHDSDSTDQGDRS